MVLGVQPGPPTSAPDESGRPNWRITPLPEGRSLSDDLMGQIGGLSDADAIAALALVLDVEDASSEVLEQLQMTQDQLAEAFASTPGLHAVTAPEQGATQGEVARAALSYLAGSESVRQLVGQAVARPRREGQRDPFTFAVGGLVLLALKSDVQLQRTTSGKWSFSFRLKPTNDTALADILGKLWTLFGKGG